MQTDRNFTQRLAASLAAVLTNGELIQSPGYHSDRLFSSSYPHPESNSTCEECDPQWVIQRERRSSDSPRVHYGLIASGNQVMKDAIKRDKLAKARNILCIEMEAAGLMDTFECLVVRGICDYSDSHKIKIWQPYAAASAAAYVKTLLEVVHRRQGQQTPEKQLQISPELDEYLCELFVTDPNENRRSLMVRRGRPSENTCQWVFGTDELAKWLDPRAEDNCPADSVLWLHGLPGSGKSTMAMCLTEGLEQRFEGHKQDPFAYFFCEANHDTQNTATSILRGLLWQLVRQNPILGDCLVRRFRERKDTLLSSFDALWTTFTDIAVDPRCGVSYCIIDALDECDFESQMLILRQPKLSFFDRPSNQFTSNVRILITSRPYKEIATYLKLFPSRDLTTFEEGKRDIDIVIEQKVGDLDMCKNYPDGMRSRIQNILKEKAEGTFLWVGLACNELMNVDMQYTLSFLESLAPDLNALYAKLMEKAVESEQKRERVYSILAVVAVSRQALTLSQLCMACSLYKGEEEGTRIKFTREDVAGCHLMVVERDGLVNLLHKSVQDFLFRSDLTQFPTIEESHAQLAYSCINYTAKRFQKPLSGLEKLLDDIEYRYLYPVPKKLGILHIAAKWGISQLVTFALGEQSANGGNFYVDTEFLTSKRSTPLEEAAKSGSMGSLTDLVSRSNPATIITDSVLTAVFRFNSNRNDLIAGLLKNIGHQVFVNKKLEIAAAQNDGEGPEILKLLLAHRDRKLPASKPHISESVLVEVARNKSKGKQIMEFIFNYLNHEVSVTERLLEAAAENTKCANVLLDMLLDHWKKPDIPESVVAAAAGNRTEGPVAIQLLQRRTTKAIQLTDSILYSAFENTENGIASLEQLWKESSQPTIVGERAVRHYRSGNELVLCWALSQPCDCVVLSKDATRSVWANRSVTVIKKILTQCREGLDLPENLLVAAAGNEYHGPSIFTFLFLSYFQQVQVTETMVEAAAKSNKKTLKLILAHRPAYRDVVSQEAIDNAAHLKDGSLEVMGALFDAKTGPICIGQQLMDIVFDNAMMANLILDQPNVTVDINSTVIAILAYQDGKENLMERFLTLPEHRIKVSREGVESIVEYYGRNNTKLLLHREDITLPSDSIKFIVQHHDAELVSLMLDEWQIEMTRELQYAACRNSNAPGILALLIEGTSGDLSLNERVLEIVVSECEQHIIKEYFQRLLPDTWTRNMISVLVSCQSKSKYTQPLVQLLLQCHEDAWIDQQVTEEIAECCHEPVVAIALQRSEWSMDNLLMAALNNVNHGSAVLKQLLVGDDIPKFSINAELIYGMARISDPETMYRMVQQRYDSQPTLSMFLLLWAATENRNSGDRVIESLLIIDGANSSTNVSVKQKSPP
ncbi:hypothetical protein AWENTII_001610 [Aspergillus wentii]